MLYQTFLVICVSLFPTLIIGQNLYKAAYQYTTTGQIASITTTKSSQNVQYFEYDHLQQLISNRQKNPIASHRKHATPTITYNLNGDILKLVRLGQLGDASFGIIDSLQYNYHQSILTHVTDYSASATGFKDNTPTQSQVDYAYDANGNIIRDRNKSAIIAYEPTTNKISRILLENDHSEVTFILDAKGKKLAEIVYKTVNTQIDTLKTLYVNDITYNWANGYWSLTRINNALYNKPNDSTRDYHGNSYTEIINDSIRNYNDLFDKNQLPTNTRIKLIEGHYTSNGNNSLIYSPIALDHLNSVQLIVSDINSNGRIDTAQEIMQSNSYYPFGLTYNEGNQAQLTANFPYVYNGMLRLEHNNINLLDYGARYYDPTIARWHGVDPLAELAPGESPYIYVTNNPLIYIDPDGKFKIPIHGRIIEMAFKQSGLSPGFWNLFKTDVKLGATYAADITGVAADFHFDNRQNYAEVKSTWESLSKKTNEKIHELGAFNRKFGGANAVTFGIMLHTIQDFYAHSNYVELYVEYYKSENDGAIPTSIPIYDVAHGGSSNSTFKALLKEKLRTGDFHILDNEFTNPNGERAQKPTSHNKMNKDKVDTLVGALAKEAAIGHTALYLKGLKKISAK